MGGKQQQHTRSSSRHQPSSTHPRAGMAGMQEAPFDPDLVPFLMKARETPLKQKRDRSAPCNARPSPHPPLATPATRQAAPRHARAPRSPRPPLATSTPRHTHPSPRPSLTTPDRSQVDMSVYEGGSASLRNLNKAFRIKRAAVETAAEEVKGRKDARNEKKVNTLVAAADLVAQYERCGRGCECDTEPCPMLGMKQCLSCAAAGRPSIKPRICAVRECIAARKGPALPQFTYQPPNPLI